MVLVTQELLIFKKKIGLNLRLSSKHVKKEKQKIITYCLTKSFVGQQLKYYLKKINDFAYNLRSRKGMRNRLGLPSRGQQTRTNAKTKKKFKIRN